MIKVKKVSVEIRLNNSSEEGSYYVVEDKTFDSELEALRHAVKRNFETQGEFYSALGIPEEAAWCLDWHPDEHYPTDYVFCTKCAGYSRFLKFVRKAGYEERDVFIFSLRREKLPLSIVTKEEFIV